MFVQYTSLVEGVIVHVMGNSIMYMGTLDHHATLPNDGMSRLWNCLHGI